MTKAIIFDLDGTILNTLDDLGNACNHALTHFGYPENPLKDYEQKVGNGFIVLVMRSLPKGVAESLPKKEFDAIANFAKDYYAKHMFEYTKPYLGLPEALEILHKKGIHLAVLSNKPEPMTQALVAHMYPHIPFAPVCGGRDDFPLKPDPTRLQAMLAELTVSAQECLYVGDSNVDMMTAHAAHIRAIGVAWGFRGAKELLSFGAEKLLQEPKEIVDLVP